MQRATITTLAVAACIQLVLLMCMHAQPVHGLPPGFYEDKMLGENTALGLLMQMVHLPDGRALLLNKAGKMFIAAPSKKGKCWPVVHMSTLGVTVTFLPCPACTVKPPRALFGPVYRVGGRRPSSRVGRCSH